MKEQAAKMKGIEAIMHTPFKDDFAVDFDGAETVANHIVTGGVVEGTGMILIGGAVGEFHSMTIEERKTLHEVVLNVAKDGTPVLVNASHTYPLVVKDLLRHAEKHGAYGAQVSPPFYMPLSGKELVRFYKDVCEETSLAIMGYADYWASQAYFDEIWEELIRIPTLVGIKWAHPNIAVFVETLIQYSDELAFIQNSTPGLIGVQCGGAGIVSQGGGFAPSEEGEFWKAVEKKDWQSAQEYQDSFIMPYRTWMRKVADWGIHGEGFALKESCKLLGLPAGPSRPPHDIPVPPEFSAELEVILRNANMLG